MTDGRPVFDAQPSSWGQRVYTLLPILFGAIIGVVLCAVGILVYAKADAAITAAQVLKYGLAGLIGGLVGAGELISRYRDEPTRAVFSPPALFYILVNIAAAMVAFYLVVALKLEVSQNANDLFQILIAGFGAVAFFRTSIFTARVGGSDILVGPAFLLQTILEASDREVDRTLAAVRSPFVRQHMASISFTKAYKALPLFCLKLMQNVPASDQRTLAQRIQEIRDSDGTNDRQKAMILGLELLNMFGEQVVQKAITALGDDIRAEAVPQRTTTVAGAAGGTTGPPPAPSP